MLNTVLKILTSIMSNLFFLLVIIVLAVIAITLIALADVGIGAIVAYLTPLSLSTTSLIVALLSISVVFCIFLLRENPMTRIIKDAMAQKKGQLVIESVDNIKEPTKRLAKKRRRQ